MSRAGETNGDSKARAEDGRRPRNRAEISGDGEVKTATTSRFQERLRQVAQSLEFLLSGWLQRSEAAGVPVGDGTEERVSRRLEGGPTGGMHLLDRAQFQGPSLDGLLPAPSLSQGNQSKTSAADAEDEDEHYGQSVHKREDLLYDLVLLFGEPRL